MNELPSREVAVFNAALLLPVAERAAYLELACSGDANLHERVRALLEASERASGFMEEPASGAQRPRLTAERDAASSPSSSLAEKPGDWVGRYKLLQQIGEGGCGVVYMAEQEEPVRRRVALKVIKLGMDTRAVIARFEAERQALALMEHPNIACVLDAGATDAGRPFFVMELVRGLKIADFCDQGNVATHERLGLFIKVCQAIQHAHQKGIIHRDIKPSNILVTVNDGVAVPKVIDFGIAKATQGRLTDQTLFTAFEQFIGTPAYMSPEQAVLTSLDIDTRSDIYSLGVLLYELLTGRTPFDQKELLATGLEEMRRTIREKEPLRPSTRLTALLDSELTTVARERRCEPPRLLHFVRGDLDWIVMKCLEKDRGRRYETANGLAMDVQRFLANEPIVARPPSGLYRLQKSVRRNKFAFSAAGAVFGALILGLGLSTWQFLEKSRAEREQNRLRLAALQAETNEARLRNEAEAQELASRKRAYAADMNLLQQALATDDLARAQDLLNRQRPQPGQQDLRGWEWRYFWQFCQSDAAFTLCQRSSSICSVAFSANGSLMAVGTYAGEVTVWNMATRTLLFQESGIGTTPARLAFAPTGSILALGEEVSKNLYHLVLLDLDKGSKPLHLQTEAAIRDIAFIGDDQLCSNEFSRSNNITIWDLASGTIVRRMTGGTPTYAMGTLFAATSDGQRFVHTIGGSSQSVRVVDATGGWETTMRVSDELTTALAFADGGRTLVTGSGYAEGAIKLWNLETRQSVGRLDGHRSWVSQVKVLSDGKTLVSASADRTVRFWDLKTRQLIRTLHGSGGELWTADVSQDGRWVASGSKDGSVVIWDLAAAAKRAQPVRKMEVGQLDWWAYSPDGRWLCAMRSRHLDLYDSQTLRPLDAPNPACTNIAIFAWSKDCRRFVVGEVHGPMSVWDVPDKRLVTSFPVAPAPDYAFTCAFLSGDTNLITFGSDCVARVWDTSTWQELRSWRFGSDEAAFAVNPTKGLAVYGTLAGKVELVDAQNPGRRREFHCQPRLSAVEVSPDGRTLAEASENGIVELWDIATETRTALLRGVLLGYHSLAISPHGERLAAASNGQEAVKLWDLESHEEVATLSGQGSYFQSLQFSPDGNTIGARNWNGVVHLWSAPSWKEIEAAEAEKEHKKEQRGF
jgi:WD40 repeat protein/serine/threonine protein kinase